jgi:mannose-6-phosphate isomerase-like protein (cupin superfamily)
MMHNHDTNETFVVISGTWMFEWEGHHGDESVILKERDIVSFEPGMQRRFECMSSANNADKGVILGVIGGDNPAAEFSPESIERLKELGVEVQQAAE